MQGKTSRAAGHLILALALIGGLTVMAAGENPAVPAAGEVQPCPVALNLTVKKAQAEHGVSLIAEVRNQGTQPLKLVVCSDKHHCCVRGLHPLVGTADPESQVGLTDPCADPHAKPHEVVVPVKEAYSTAVEIPADHLPADSRKAGDKVCFQVCFELANGKLALSNIVIATLE